MDCVRRGEEPGGLMGRVKATWFVGAILGGFDLGGGEI